ncbi:MAG TPA: AAA family ATPase [Solirubrobacteraceae bacterium]|jgi:DNA-binding CsgD family transcriptional regulator/predicted negative regulator of RcsB-dependent stress response|nr:AAA family ATPase [Solirubrobacteraceae bacterium]
MPSRLTSNHFVGRVGELAELELAVREASDGRPTLVLLGGDSGVGKTRLVGELEHRLSAGRDDAPLILRGEGVEQADGELPYAPLLSALRPLVRERHPAVQDLSQGSRQALATILPGLEPPEGAADGRAANDQLRLFEAILELIDCLSTIAPLVLILEDMHWADRSTRAFTAFLARTMRQERACLILTYRADELHRRHPLRPLLSDLERLERARRIQLAPFDRAELSEALADILGAEPDGHMLDRLFIRSEGNPLYTEELLAAGLDGRGAAPQSLRDAFLVRIERLSADAQRVARAVAVARAADETMLAAVTGVDRDVLQGALRESVAEQVLVAAADGRFGFRHALLREALYDDLLPGERGELHIELAQELEQRCGADDDRELERASSIAAHYAAAGDQPHALRSTIAAARAAHKVYAYGEASDLTERALELWPRVDDPEQVAGLDHVRLLAMAAEAHQILDERQRSAVLIGEALRELDPETNPARYAGLLAQQARIVASLNRGEEALDIAEHALAMLPEDDPGGERPLLLAWLARNRYLRGRFRHAASEGAAALEVAIAAGDRVAETELLNTLGMAYVSLGQIEKGISSLKRAIELARANDDFDSLATAYSNLADKLAETGQTEEALRTAREGLSVTPTHHVRSYAWMELTVAETAFAAGDWRTAQDSLTPSPSRAAGLRFIFRKLIGALVALGIGDEDGAAECLDAAHDLVTMTNQPQWISLYGALRADLLVRRRDLAGARAAVQQALDRLEVCTDDVTGIAWVSCIGLWVEADRAQRARDLRESGDRRDALARARLHGDRLAAAAQDGGPVERARLAQGKAELARARGRSTTKEWHRAAVAWDELKRPYPAAIARWREAEALAGADDRPGAAEAAAAALATAEKLGSEWLVREIRTLGERARLDLGTVSGAGASAAAVGNGNGAGRADAAEEDPFGLTPRERQVLALLAEGATNRQIGAALFMAEKTASVHVSRILAKLGVQGRTQAAAVAHRLHLA